MARLPVAADLARRMPGVSPDVNVGAVDYGPQAAGGAAIARGMDSIGRAGNVLAARIEQQQQEIDDFETAKKLTDFKLATEMELEERKRSMPVGGAGYTSSWAETYRERASGFVGEKDANIPERLRGRVGLQLKQWEAALVERAQRDEFAERDRHTIAGLETTVNQHVSRVMADPTRHDMVQGDLDKLITLAPITPAQRDVFRRKVREETSYAAAMAYAERATTAQGREEARRILAPNSPDRRAAGLPTNYLDEIKKSEGYTEVATWDYKQHSVGYGSRARFPGERITKEEAERRLAADMDKAAAIVDAFAPNLPAGTRAALMSLTHNAGDAWTRSGLGQAVQSGNTAAIKERFLQYTRAGGEELPGLKARRIREAAWIGQGAQQGAPSEQPDAYSGTLNLPLARRRQAAAHAETVYARAVEQTSKLVNSTIADATKGILPPQPIMDQLAQRVAAVGDPMLSAQYESLVRRTVMTEVLRAQPPAVLTMTAQAERARIQANGGTREEVEAVEHREKMAAESAREYNDNPIGWAQKRRPVLPMREDTPPEALALIRDGRTDEALQRFPEHLRRAEFQQLNFAAPDIGQQLDDRAAVARAVARYGGGQPRMFAPNEVAFIQKALSSEVAVTPDPVTGQIPLVGMMREIAKAAERNNLDATEVMSEVSKGGRELSMIGHIIANNGNERLIQEAVHVIGNKHRLGEKFESTIVKTQANPTLAGFEKMFTTAPEARDSLKAMANLVYEYRSRRDGVGLTNFSQSLYDTIVREIMGEVKGPDGTTYGGVGYQGNSWWFDGKWASPVLVPGQVRQDSFDSMIGALRADDLNKVGIPRDIRGVPYSITDIRNMEFESYGPPGVPPIPGVYGLIVARSPNGQHAYALNEGGERIVLDLRPILPDLKKRRPDIFINYDGNASGVVVPDRPYPSAVASVARAKDDPPTSEQEVARRRGNEQTRVEPPTIGMGRLARQRLQQNERQ